MNKFLSLIIFSIVILLTFSSFRFADEIFENFRIGFVPIEDKIMLRWKSIDEATVDHYPLVRSIDNMTFSQLVTLQPQGNNFEYEFIDDSILKTSARTFYYRLHIQLDDESFQESNIVSLAPRISSTRQTLGSIKAIFQ